MDLPKDYHSDSSHPSSPVPSAKNGSNSRSSRDSQNSHQPLYRLKIFSYGSKLGPLPAPSDNQRQLDYDLSDIAKPPEAIREGNTGLYPEVQCVVVADNYSESRLKQIQQEIKTAMDEIEAPHLPESSASAPDSGSLPNELLIALVCGSGKHRSVTFAEQICRYFQRAKNKRQKWGVTLEHRDLDVAHDHEHMYEDESDDGQGAYEGNYAILSKSRSAHLGVDLEERTGKERKRNLEEASRNIRQGGARVVEAPS
ncbi:hypothetical protein H2200_006577 [Cladophialophora chaetospira]|uniref:RapZ C-terminal domain-containing protein n=1 Tax=Cladophialophora chaetospira TaxID=386627 RepID=A0AA38X8G9_9EURO|nr:hypothetical protein H2200_006577 [Cladophialophora chaetospira]